MGATDIERQAINVYRMKLLGARVVPVTSGSKTSRTRSTKPCAIGSATWTTPSTSSAPWPARIRIRCWCVISTPWSAGGAAQMLDEYGRLPDAVTACVGGGSNAIGMFHAFLNDRDVRSTVPKRRARASRPGVTPPRWPPVGQGVLHGNRTYLLCDDDGQIIETHSVSAGLDYPGVGPEHAFLKDTGRATTKASPTTRRWRPSTCWRAPKASWRRWSPRMRSRRHQAGARLAEGCAGARNLSGRGDKDIYTIARREGITL
jgi:tryptophan synthase beta chain